MNGVLITFLLCFIAASGSGFYNGYGLQRRNTFLVTMSPQEKLEITACAANARNPLVCEHYMNCMTLLPPRVLGAFKRCRQAYVGSSWPQCFSGWPALAPSAIRSKIFDCFSTAPRDTPQELMAVVQFEKCARDFRANACTHQLRQGLH